MASKNTQARVKSEKHGYAWDSYGDVTHVQAAELHAFQYPFSYSVIETRWEGHETTFDHEVVRSMEFKVTPLRGESNG